MGGVWAGEQAEHGEHVWMSNAEQPPCSQTAGDQMHVAKKPTSQSSEYSFKKSSF